MGQKAALYCRVSTAEQSCERQEQDLIAYANRCGYEVVGANCIIKNLTQGVEKKNR